MDVRFHGHLEGNNGKGFTLEFDNNKAERTSSSNIVINGTMYVEKEKFYRLSYFNALNDGAVLL
jgi:hypothetical protein